MPCEVVFAAYRPKPGREPAVLEILKRHVPTLRRLGLATERPVVLIRSPGDGTLIEVFEWATSEASREAHTRPEVEAIWHALGEEAEFPALAEVAGAGLRFPHFEPVDGVVR